MDQLKEVLKDRPEIEFVYLNEKGEWIFHENPRFPNKLTRDQVLNAKEATEKTEPVAPVSPVSPPPGNITDPLLEKAQKQKEADEKAQAAKDIADAKAEAEKIEAEVKAEADKAAAEAEAQAEAQAKAQAEKNKIEAKSDKSKK